MDVSALPSVRKPLSQKLLIGAAAAVLLILASIAAQAQPDPPAQGGRISYITGNVSIQQAGSDDWGQALPNLPLGPGDRVFTDSDGQAEIQVGQTFLRIGPNSDVSVVDSTPTGLYFGVAQGSVHFHAFGLWDGQSVYVNTPSGSATLATPGQFRVDVLPDQQATVFSSFGVNLLTTGAGGFAQYISTNQCLELVGSNPVTPQWLQMAEWDSLDQWSYHRDQQIAEAASYQYVSREIPGAYELDAAGTWSPGTPYGPIWFPNNVPGGWAPYHYGHWVNHAPWGSVWVEDEPWGYAPFHYGRWVSFGGRWGWVPGPPAAHPIWSPALVAFAGGIHVGGFGVSAWFPLGPGEPYRPWYPASPRYIDQVNITNIVEAPQVHVQTTYVNINVVNVVYVNRTIGVAAMSQQDFAAGRPAHQAAVVVDVHLLEHPQVIQRPEVQVSVRASIGHPPARPVPVSAARPVLINAQGKAFSAKPGAQPVEPPVRNTPAPRPLPGHTAIAPPPGASKPGDRTPPPAPKAAPLPAGKPATQPMTKPAVPTPPKPATEPAPKATPPAPKPAAAPAPKAPQESTAKPATETTTKPAAANPSKPAGTPATTAKPGTKPPAKTDKDKEKKDQEKKDNPNGE